MIICMIIDTIFWIYCLCLSNISGGFCDFGDISQQLSYHLVQFIIQSKIIMKVTQQFDYSKFQYLNCREKEHEDQFLNLVCIQKDCKRNGLICSLCKEDHKHHRIIPLKFLMATLKNKINAPPDENIYCSKLQELQNLKQGMFYNLKCCIQNLADQFRQLQLDIIESYNKIKSEIIEQIQLGMQFDDLMAYAMTINSVLKQDQYMEIFRKISKRINYQDKNIDFTYDFTNIMIPFQEKEKKILTNLKEIQENLLQKLKNINLQVMVKEVKNIVPISTKLKYRFSNQYKPINITLNELRTIAKQTSSIPSRIVIIQEGMGLKNQKIMFKVDKLKNWIGLGVCVRDKIVAANYAFKYETLGHGSYLLSNNGYTWSHSRKQDNIISWGYKFAQDDKIQVSLTEKELIFVVYEKQANKKDSFKLKIQFKESQWPQVCFCANLCSADDSIQILDE